MRNFICISGKAQNGKDTSAEIFKNELIIRGHSVLVIHQADLLKYICKAFFNWNGEKDEAGRTLLQQVGTNVIRKVEPDFWVDFIAKVTGFFKDTWDYIIVPDTRFPNELEKLKANDANIFHVRVIREGFKSPLTEEQQQHPSETALDGIESDFTLINDKGIDDLYGGVVSILDAIEERIKES
ncbi:hypothetical protein [Xylanibacter rodentium]|uniref:deoxynucleotide monophosphate kinase family protein n=1 Tax=Xylanibacter rodentium TaxID=2736289 RepID=UPI00259A94E1|nr:hypothetical protein [Xylanibacter rodentium]